MKDLQKAIEEILRKHLHCVMRGSDTANNTTYRGVTASAFLTSEGMEELTQLITSREQEIREEAETKVLMALRDCTPLSQEQANFRDSFIETYLSQQKGNYETR